MFMRKVSLLFALAVAGLTSFGQQNVKNIQVAKDACVFSNDVERQHTRTTQQGQVKAPGDVVWSEDFSGLEGDATNLPAGWTMTDDAGIGGWVTTDTCYDASHTSPYYAQIGSATADNGYMHFPLNRYNSVWNDATGEWDFDGTQDLVDATLETPNITVPSGTPLVLQFDTWFRYCCDPAMAFDVNVSGDNGATWTTFSGRTFGGIEVALNDYPPEYVNQSAKWIADITSVVAAGGAGTVKIQFRVHGAAFYFTSIDDIEIVEPLANDMEIWDYYAKYSTLTFNRVCRCNI